MTDILSRLKSNIDNTNIPDDWQKLTDQKLIITVYNDLQKLLQHIRNEEYYTAEYKASDIAVRLAMLAAEERKG
jgi:hypothetical protein